MLKYKDYDVVVVGAGLTGAVISRHLAENGKKVILVEKRNEIGGNLFDYKDENGILVQKYGPHVFHTNSDVVYNFIKKYTDIFDFVVNCEVYMKGKYTPSPFNFKTIDQYYDLEKAEKIKAEIKKEYPNERQKTIVELLESKNKVVKEFADFLFESDYSLYTAKQWGIAPSEIDVSVLKRVPVLFNYDEKYFYDKYQFMPKKGFSFFVASLLEHQNITIVKNYDFLNDFKIDKDDIYLNNEKTNQTIVFTGAIDMLFGYSLGKLPYRSLRFDFKVIDSPSYQNAPIVAYPEVEGYTRITEYTKMPYQINTKTSIAIEYPEKYNEQINEPYYPILTAESLDLYEKYKVISSKYPNLFTCGRLADFKYFNMDQAILNAFEMCKLLDEYYEKKEC